ncbi:unnamed protein product [Meloidogyne enterolobii]|uniref:Uncharacterized protein n=2 Tax=Meloidogyne enterolobii TaxID=390850 RepID=A0ACB0Y726_MELEN|nr:unnamed protein product [Meloidogyne enterolobii]
MVDFLLHLLVHTRSHILASMSNIDLVKKTLRRFLGRNPDSEITNLFFLGIPISRNREFWFFSRIPGIGIEEMMN